MGDEYDTTDTSQFDPGPYEEYAYETSDGWMYWGYGVFALLMPVVLVMQIVCVVHVFKTGRPYWWMWVILWFPVIGVIAYVICEMRPSWRSRGISLDKLMWQLKSPDQKIATREAVLDQSLTIKNRLLLATELHEHGRYEREIEVLSDGLRGAFKDDNELRLRLVEAMLESEQIAEAAQLLKKIEPDESQEQRQRHKLLAARTAANQGQHEEAERMFEELLARNDSEAPRYYHACHLLKKGMSTEGRGILQDILQKYRRGTVVWRHRERRWFYAAKRRLKQGAA